MNQVLYTSQGSGVPYGQRTDILSKALKNEFDQWIKQQHALRYGSLGEDENLRVKSLEDRVGWGRRVENEVKSADGYNF